MRRRSAGKPPTKSGRPYSERLGKHVGPPELQKDTDGQIIDAAIEEKVRRLVLQGHTHAAIAREIGRDERTVGRIKARVNEEYRANHPGEIEAFVEIQLGRYNNVTRIAAVRAFGGTVIEKDPSTGKEVERRVEPSLEWMDRYLKAQRQIDMLLAGRQALKIEHIGANGGPIQTMNVRAPAEMARMLRERFTNSVRLPPKVLAPAVVDAPAVLDATVSDGSDSKH